MTTYQGLQGRVHKMLQQVPWTRERARKDEALVKLVASRKLGNDFQAVFNLKELTEMAKDLNSADRYWRLLLNSHPELRGSDYDTKAVVEHRKELSLGYEPGYHQLSHLKV